MISKLPSLAAVPSPGGNGGIKWLIETESAAIMIRNREDIKPVDFFFMYIKIPTNIAADLKKLNA